MDLRCCMNRPRRSTVVPLVVALAVGFQAAEALWSAPAAFSTVILGDASGPSRLGRLCTPESRGRIVRLSGEFQTVQLLGQRQKINIIPRLHGFSIFDTHDTNSGELGSFDTSEQGRHRPRLAATSRDEASDLPINVSF
jgi:hypothetical protein